MAAVGTQQGIVDETIMEKGLGAMALGEGRNATPGSAIPKSTHTSSATGSFLEKPTGVVKTPFLNPAESTKPKATIELTSEQEAKYTALLETVKSWKEIPSTSGKGGPILESEIMWLSRECLLRYLRATKWVTADAVKRLLGTLSWRRDYGIDDLLDGETVSPENETGKQIILGYDISARPCHYLNPGRQNTQPSPRQVQHLVFMLERVVDLMIPGQESLALLINFKQSKNRSNTAPGIGQGREVLNILQTHYPERLGRALIINIPWVVWGFFKLITPFIDPLTREKLKFNEDVRLHVPPEQLWKEFGGDVDFEYDHATYWPALLKLCTEKRAEQKTRWEKAGKRYGESEMYLKGGEIEVDTQCTTVIDSSSVIPATDRPAEESVTGRTQDLDVSGNSNSDSMPRETTSTTE